MFCVYFTSGSSGSPKAAAAPAAGVLRIGLDPFFRFTQATRILQVSSAAMGCLCAGNWCPLVHRGDTIMSPEMLPTVEGIERHISLDGLDDVSHDGALQCLRR